jgi:hypothetical protein
MFDLARDSQRRPLLRVLIGGGTSREGGERHGATQVLPGSSLRGWCRGWSGRRRRGGSLECLGDRDRIQHDRHTGENRIRSRYHGGSAVRGPRHRRSRWRDDRQEARQSTLTRVLVSRVVRFVVVLLVTATGMMAASQSAFAETTIDEGGYSWVERSPGVWDNTSTGYRVIMGTEGQIVQVFTPSETAYWQRVEEGVGANMSEGGTPAELEQQIVRDVPNITQGEAEDSVQVLTKLREGASSSVDSAMLNLGEETGGVLTGSELLSLAGTTFGALAFGPTAFQFGVDIGNGIDELFGLPTWTAFQGEQLSAAKASSCKVEWVSSPVAPNSKAVYSATGYMIKCIGSAYSTDRVTECDNGYKLDEGWYEGRSGGVAVQESESFPYGEVCFAGGKEPYSGKVVKKAAFFMICAAAVSGGACLLKNTSIPGSGVSLVQPPGPGLLTKGVEEENVTHGLISHPTVVLSPVPRGRHLTSKQTAQFYYPEGKVVEKSVAEKSLAEHDPEKHVGTGGAIAPGPKFIEENGTHRTESANETPVEPAPENTLFTAPVAKLKLPSFGALCKNFPFGVPCWMLQLLEKWSATGKAPSLEVPIMGKKLAINLGVIEPAMEIIRPVFVLSALIGLVFTFFSFAIGGAGGVAGGGGDD